MNEEKVYEQVCQDIRVTDDISFKLLGLVPLIPTVSLVAMVLKGEVHFSTGLLAFSWFGAFITLGLFRWELRNISTCEYLRSQAVKLEKSLLGTTDLDSKWDSPGLIGSLFKTGKTEAEKFIYALTVVAWLALPLVATYPLTGVQCDPWNRDVLMNVHLGVSIFCGFILCFALATKTNQCQSKDPESDDANSE